MWLTQSGLLCVFGGAVCARAHSQLWSKEAGISLLPLLRAQEDRSYGLTTSHPEGQSRAEPNRAELLTCFLEKMRELYERSWRRSVVSPNSSWAVSSCFLSFSWIEERAAGASGILRLPLEVWLLLLLFIYFFWLRLELLIHFCGSNTPRKDFKSPNFIWNTRVKKKEEFEGKVSGLLLWFGGGKCGVKTASRRMLLLLQWK